MGKETEFKYEVGDLQLLDCILCDRELRSRMQADFSYIQMQTTYFDTPEQVLSQNRQMLRVRRENEKSVVCFKTAGDGATRGEWETEGSVLSEALPKLVQAGAPQVLLSLCENEELLPVCGARFTRITAPLSLDGCTATLCGDVGELYAGAKSIPLCELELELSVGSEEALFSFGRQLAERYGIKEGNKSKFARANALKEGN